MLEGFATESVDVLLELLDPPLPPVGADADDAPILSSVESFLDEFEPLEATDKLLQSGNAASTAHDRSPEQLLLEDGIFGSPALLPAPFVNSQAPLPAIVGPVAGVKPQQPRHRRRRRPQEEIDDLHREVYELTVQLDALKFQQTHGTAVDPAVLRAMPPASWKALGLAQTSWLAKAAAVQQARQNSEFENQWLRALVKSTTARSDYLRGVFEHHIAASVRRCIVKRSVAVALTQCPSRLAEKTRNDKPQAFFDSSFASIGLGGHIPGLA